ncbi:MAG: hypothetical protein FJX63_04560 [Alphaproteobacteria bacterium]|nr:hypothetical protein [Alphaproteobacteria bacterium]
MKRRGATKIVKIVGPLTVNSSMAIVSAAAAGLGLALVPAVLVEQQLRSGNLVSVLEDWECEPSALWALVPQHRQGSRAVRLLVEHLQRALR